MMELRFLTANAAKPDSDAAPGFQVTAPIDAQNKVISGVVAVSRAASGPKRTLASRRYRTNFTRADACGFGDDRWGFRAVDFR